MRRAVLALLPLTLLFAPRADAQRPTITVVPINTALERLNAESYLDDDEDIELAWSVSGTVLNSYDYEITYDSASTEATRAKQVCLDETFPTNDPRGRAQASGRIRLTKAQIMDKVNCPPQGSAPDVDRQDRRIVIRVYLASNEFDDTSAATASWQFQVDTRPPPAPVIQTTLAGENQVRVSWTSPGSDIDVDTYEVLYCRNAPEPGTDTSTVALPCDSPKVVDMIAKTQFDYSIEDDLKVGEHVAVAVRAVDEADNVESISGVKYATLVEVTDFFEAYKDADGSEDGGFCFVATAAYGSYAHPAVRVLRLFRDRVLKQTALGSLAVTAYYALSPPVANAVRADPSLRAFVRIALVPVTLIALLILAAPFLGALFLVSRVARRGRKGVALGGALLVLAGAPASARGESSRLESKFNLIGLGFEFRGGPYRPQIAKATGGPDYAFTTIFGKGTEPSTREPPGHKPLFGLGAEIQLFRGFGTAGIGGSFGFLQYVGKALAESGLQSSDTTVFNLLPLTLTAVYRFDWFVDQANFPLVPYARGGLAYHIWWVTDGSGDTSNWDDGEGGREFKGRGGKFGLTGTLGVSFLLNFIEPKVARNMYEGTSVRGTYVFGEYQVNDVDGFGGDGFDFSDNTWNFGLFVEL